MTYSANANPFTLGRPVTEWWPGGEWAIFMALNCRKDLPNVTRQKSNCLCWKEKGPWIHNAYDFEPWSHFSQLSWFIHFSGSVSLNKSYIHFGKLQPKEGLVVTGENVSGNSMLNNVLRDCHHLFFVCYLFFHFSGFFRKKFIPSPITHPDNIIHQCSNAWSVSNSQDNIKAECKL